MENLKARFDSRRRSDWRFVYFVLAEELGRIKIGVSNDVEARLASLRTNCPDRLSIIGVIYSPVAEEIEGAAHRQFADLRLNGEWFRDDPAIRDFLTERGETIGAFSQRQAAEAATKIAARYSAPVEAVDDDCWRVPEGGIPQRSTLASYKAARGLS